MKTTLVLAILALTCQSEGSVNWTALAKKGLMAILTGGVVAGVDASIDSMSNKNQQTAAVTTVNNEGISVANLLIIILVAVFGSIFLVTLCFITRIMHKNRQARRESRPTFGTV